MIGFGFLLRKNVKLNTNWFERVADSRSKGEQKSESERWTDVEQEWLTDQLEKEKKKSF